MPVIGRGSALLAMATGGWVLLGWWTGDSVATSIMPGFASMKVNTALTFIVCGVSLAASISARPTGANSTAGSHRLARVGAIFVLFVALLTMAEYGTGFDLGIDQLLCRQDEVGNLAPGRMAPATAISFAFFALALLGSEYRTKSGAHPWHWLVLPVACNGFLAVLGYLYGVEALYRVAPFSSVAVHTAVLFVVLSVGFVCAAPGNGLAQFMVGDGMGSLLARRLVPAAVLLPPLLGWLRLLGERAGYFGLPFGLALFATSNVVVFSALVWHTARTVERIELARAQVAAELTRVNQVLERSNQELEQFAYVATHDLVAPLRSISGFLDLFRSSYGAQLDARATEWIERAVAAAMRMHRLIQDVLAYARIDTSAPVMQPVALDGVVATAREFLASTIDEVGAVVTSDPLPTVPGDSSQLLQLFTNLLANALKYRGTETPRIHISARREESHWIGSVRDNGIGIAAEHHWDVFELFHRLHGRQEYPGTGIGLAVCRRVVERHGGRIWVESAPGAGSVFWFSLPAEWTGR